MFISRNLVEEHWLLQHNFNFYSQIKSKGLVVICSCQSAKSCLSQLITVSNLTSNNTICLTFLTLSLAMAILFDSKITVKVVDHVSGEWM